MIRVFIGYDHRESVAFYTLVHSILRRSSQPVQISPIALHQLKEIHDRPRERFQSNDFTFARWLVPFLCDYEGWAVYLDCDMVMLEDIAEMWAYRDSAYAVKCVKHSYQPTEQSKYLGNPQDAYVRKNWSSVMLMNCAACTTLTPEYVNSADRLDLHQFNWLDDGMETRIGELPSRWNHLVGYGNECSDAAIVHFTKGGPYFKEYLGVEHSLTWIKENIDMVNCSQYEEAKK